jgi:hypothetical protein
MDSIIRTNVFDAFHSLGHSAFARYAPNSNAYLSSYLFDFTKLPTTFRSKLGIASLQLAQSIPIDSLVTLKVIHVLPSLTCYQSVPVG